MIDEVERKAAWDAWVAELPEPVQAIARAYPISTCYTGPSGGHYIIRGYFDPELPDNLVTLRVQHITDSHNLPGVQVVGMKPEDLELCGCLLNR